MNVPAGPSATGTRHARDTHPDTRRHDRKTAMRQQHGLPQSLLTSALPSTAASGSVQLGLIMPRSKELAAAIETSYNAISKVSSAVTHEPDHEMDAEEGPVAAAVQELQAAGRKVIVVARAMREDPAAQAVQHVTQVLHAAVTKIVPLPTYDRANPMCVIALDLNRAHSTLVHVTIRLEEASDVILLQALRVIGQQDIAKGPEAPAGRTDVLAASGGLPYAELCSDAADSAVCRDYVLEIDLQRPAWWPDDALAALVVLRRALDDNIHYLVNMPLDQRTAERTRTLSALLALEVRACTLVHRTEDGTCVKLRATITSPLQTQASLLLRAGVPLTVGGTPGYLLINTVYEDLGKRWPGQLGEQQLQQSVLQRYPDALVVVVQITFQLVLHQRLQYYRVPLDPLLGEQAVASDGYDMKRLGQDALAGLVARGAVPADAQIVWGRMQHLPAVASSRAHNMFTFTFAEAHNLCAVLQQPVAGQYSGGTPIATDRVHCQDVGSMLAWLAPLPSERHVTHHIQDTVNGRPLQNPALARLLQAAQTKPAPYASTAMATSASTSSKPVETYQIRARPRAHVRSKRKAPESSGRADAESWRSERGSTGTKQSRPDPGMGDTGETRQDQSDV